MKTSLRSLFAALLVGAAFIPVPGRAAGPTVESRVERLDQLVTLTPDQKAKAAEAFRLEDRELAAAGTGDDRVFKNMETRQAARDRLRALLSPAQQKIYDRAPQAKGGGLTIATPEAKLNQLDRTVGLSPEQKKVALEVFQEEFEGLMALTPSERMEKGMTYRQAAQSQVRALLSPEQRAKMESDRQALTDKTLAERKAIEDPLRAASGVVARVGSVVSISMTRYSSGIDLKTRQLKGSYTCRIVGSTGAETFTADWEKDASGQVRIVRIVTASGELVPL
jgi:hypothetical protein